MGWELWHLKGPHVAISSGHDSASIHGGTVWGSPLLLPVSHFPCTYNSRGWAFPAPAATHEQSKATTLYYPIMSVELEIAQLLVAVAVVAVVLVVVFFLFVGSCYLLLFVV